MWGADLGGSSSAPPNLMGLHSRTGPSSVNPQRFEPCQEAAARRRSHCVSPQHQKPGLLLAPTQRRRVL